MDKKEKRRKCRKTAAVLLAATLSLAVPAGTGLCFGLPELPAALAEIVKAEAGTEAGTETRANMGTKSESGTENAADTETQSVTDQTADDIPETESGTGQVSETDGQQSTADKTGGESGTNTETGTEVSAGTNSGTETGTETSAGTNSGTETGTGTSSVINSEQETGAGVSSGKNSETETGKGTSSGTDSETETGTGASSGTNSETETEKGTSPEKNPETETGTEASSGTSQTSETESEAGTETESETETETACTCGLKDEDPFVHEPDCPVFQEALFAECDCGSESRDIYEHEEECGAYLTWLILIGELDPISAYSMAETPSGTAVTGASGWTKTTGASAFSPSYYPVRFYSGISSLEYFNSSGSVVFGETSSGRHYLYPKATGQGGKFGAVYRKVLYENNQWYDLRMTVVKYTDSVACDGTGTADSFPFISMSPTSIGWNFNQALGAIVLKCEFYEHDTGTKAAVNTRFQWWDIDGGQRFGIDLVDGSIAGRYYYEGSKIYVQTGQTIAGISGMELVIGVGDDEEDTDRTCCAVYELKNCSTYYMSLGERDHINNDDYSYTRARISTLNSSLAEGTENADKHEYLRQTDTTLSVITTPEPVKHVSADGTSWGTEAQLEEVSDSYWYWISQFVPWQDTTAYYTGFSIQDQLPTGVNYAGSASVIREEDGSNVTGSFSISESEGKITVSAKSTLLSSAGFYGYHYRIRFRAMLEPELLTPAWSDNTAVYTVKNQASCVYRHSETADYSTKTSNTVVTKAEVSRVEQPEPKKSLDGAEQKQEKTILMREDQILFDIWQTVPENPLAFRPVSIELEDVFEDCLELKQISVLVQKKGSETWEFLTGWSTEQTGNTLKLSRACDVSWAGGRLHFQLVCGIKADADLSSWKTTREDGSVWTEIPNQASVTFVWAKGTPLKVTKQTNTVTVRLRTNRIFLSKELDAEDIVWAHGNPTFTFRIQGQDLNGAEHVYCRTVEFTETETADSGKVRLTAETEVPAGTWLAREEKTMRYALKEISGIQNGTAGEQSVTFDLTGGGDGAAVFYNIKTTDQDESHTDFVRNVIG